MAEHEFFSTNHFEVNIDGLKAKNFVSVDGLGLHIEALAHRQGADQTEQTRKGRVYVSNVVLRRRFDGDKEFINWIKECAQKQPVKKSGSIILKDDNQKEVLRWNFTNGWPISYEPPRFSTDEGGSVTTETVVLNVESLDIA